MAETKPPFDPSKTFTPLDSQASQKPAFDASKPYTPLDGTTTPAINTKNAVDVEVQPYGMVFLPPALKDNLTTPIVKPTAPEPQKALGSSLYAMHVDPNLDYSKIPDAQVPKEIAAKKLEGIKEGRDIEAEPGTEAATYQDPKAPLERITGMSAAQSGLKIQQLGYTFGDKGQWNKTQLSALPPEEVSKELKSINDTASQQLDALNKEIAQTAQPLKDVSNNPRLQNIGTPAIQDPKLLAKRELLIKDIAAVNQVYAEDYILKNSEGMKPAANVTSQLSDDMTNVAKVGKNLAESTDYFTQMASGTDEQLTKMFQTKAAMYRTVGQDDTKRQGLVDYINNPRATYAGFSASLAEQQKMIYEGAKYDKSSLEETIKRDKQLITQIRANTDPIFDKLKNKQATLAPSDLQQLNNLSAFATQLEQNTNVRQSVVDRIDNLYNTKLKDYVNYATEKQQLNNAVNSSMFTSLIGGAISPFGSIPRSLAQFGASTGLKLSGRDAQQKEALSHVIYDNEIEDIKPTIAEAPIFHNGINWNAMMFQSGKVFTESMALGGAGALSEKAMASVFKGAIEKATLETELAGYLQDRSANFLGKTSVAALKSAQFTGELGFGFVAPSILMFSPQAMKNEMDNKGLSFEEAYNVGMLRSSLEGAAFRLNPFQMNMVKGLFMKGEINNVAENELYEGLMKGTIKQAFNHELSNTAYNYIFNPLWKIGKEAFVEGSIQSGVGEVSLIANHLVDNHIKSQHPNYKGDNDVTIDSMFDTYLNTLATMWIPGAIAGYRKTKRDLFIQRYARMEAGRNPEVFKAKIMDNLENGLIDREEAIRQTKVVENIAEAHDAIKPELEEIQAHEKDPQELKDKKSLDLLHNELEQRDILKQLLTVDETEAEGLGNNIDNLQKEREDIKKQNETDSQQAFATGNYDEKRAKRIANKEINRFEEEGGSVADLNRYKRMRALKDQQSVEGVQKAFSDEAINNNNNIGELQGSLDVLNKILGVTEADQPEGWTNTPAEGEDINPMRIGGKEITVPVMNELLHRKSAIESKIRYLEKYGDRSKETTSEEEQHTPTEETQTKGVNEVENEGVTKGKDEPITTGEETKPEDTTTEKSVPTVEGLTAKILSGTPLEPYEAEFFQANKEQIVDLLRQADEPAPEPAPIDEPIEDVTVTPPHIDNDLTTKNTDRPVEETKALKAPPTLLSLPPYTATQVTKENKDYEKDDTTNNNIAVAENGGLKIINASATMAHIGREVEVMSTGQNNYGKSLQAADNTITGQYGLNHSAEDMLPGQSLVLKLIPGEESKGFEKQAKTTFKAIVNAGEKHVKEEDINNDNYFRVVGIYNANNKLVGYVHDLSYVRSERIAHEQPALINNLYTNYNNMKTFRDSLIPSLEANPEGLKTSIIATSNGHLSFDVDPTNYIPISDRFKNPQVLKTLQISDGTVYDQANNPTINRVKSGRAIVLLPTKSGKKFALVLKQNKLASEHSTSAIAALDIFTGQNKAVAAEFMKKYNLPTSYNPLTAKGLKNYLSLFINVSSRKPDFYSTNWKDIADYPFIDMWAFDNEDGTMDVKIKWSKQRVALGDKVSETTDIKLTDKIGRPNPLAKSQFKAFQAFISELLINVNRDALSNFRGKFVLPLLDYKNNQPTVSDQTNTFRGYQEFIAGQLSTNTLEHTIEHEDGHREFIYLEQPNIVIDTQTLTPAKEPVVPKEEAVTPPTVVAEPNKIANYKGLTVTHTDEIPTSKHVSVGARAVRYKDGENKGKVEYILVNEEALKKKFKDKAWLEPVEQKDGSKATALKEDAFKSFDDFYKFVLEHEYQHDILGPKTPEETIGQYEDRVNEAAFKEIELVDKENRMQEQDVIAEEQLKKEEEAKPTKKKRGQKVKTDIAKDPLTKSTQSGEELGKANENNEISNKDVNDRKEHCD